MNHAHASKHSDLPTSFLSQYENISYGNDECASFLLAGTDEQEEFNIKLWIEHADPELREREEEERFSVSVNGNSVYMTDSFNELQTFLTNELTNLIEEA